MFYALLFSILFTFTIYNSYLHVKLHFIFHFFAVVIVVVITAAAVVVVTVVATSLHQSCLSSSIPFPPFLLVSFCFARPVHPSSLASSSLPLFLHPMHVPKHRPHCTSSRRARSIKLIPTLNRETTVINKLVFKEV